MTILFQGDSITDANRIYETNDLGEGYVYFIKQALKDVTVLNKGISGNRTLEL
ncbi:MAG: GDSL family lipase, partial [Tenericutes bacterium HGW-Tenericutes-8]